MVCGQRSRGRGAEGTGATPTGPSEVGSDWRQDRGLGQPGQRETVPTGSRPGNRCRVRNAASPATPQGETGDVNRSSRRLTPDVRPVVDLSIEQPRKVRRREPVTRRGAFVFPAGSPPTDPTPTEPKSRGIGTLCDRILQGFGLGLGDDQRSAAARRETIRRSSRARSTVGPGKNVTSVAPASASASA